MAQAPDFTPISVAGNKVPGEQAVGASSTVAPNWNSGGWADNGPGTGGWSPQVPNATTSAPPSPNGLYKARGGATTFDSTKYNIDQFQYPADLMSATAEYGANYVIFYINVAADSKLIKDGSVQIVADATPRDNGSLAGLAGQAIPSAVDALGISQTSAIGQATGNLTGSKKRIKTAIALHIPNNIATSYNIEYEEEGMQTAALVLAGIQGTAALAKAAQKGGLSNTMKTGASGAPQAVAALGSVALNASTAAQKLTGLAPNPRKEQIFKSVGFRKFSFEYQFFPRNAQEAENVMNIIYQFKLHMHPEFKDAMQFLYIYPSEFDIFYYNNGVENLHLNRQTSAVLTDMNVVYTPQGEFTTFDNGMPTQINVTLQFTELSTLTKEKIQDGM
jgi:hypothetical protein